MEAQVSNKRKFRIAILDDDLFFGKQIGKEIQEHFRNYPSVGDKTFQVTTYSDPGQFISKLPKSTDVVVMDYYLENGINALMLIDAIKKLEIQCKIVVMSSTQNLDTYYRTFWKGAHEFIKKDKSAGNKACKIISTIYSDKASN